VIGRTVWKFTLPVNALTASFTTLLRIPQRAEFRHCAAQRNTIALWYEIPDPAAPTEPRRFQLFGTGTGTIGDHLTYVGTALFDDGALVLHVYEAGED